MRQTTSHVYLLTDRVVVLGKANMSIMSHYFHPDVPSGWCPLGGQTQSAFGPDLKVSGSSTGCAVGVSAGFCGVALGCETNGSIVSRSAVVRTSFCPSLILR